MNTMMNTMGPLAAGSIILLAVLTAILHTVSEMIRMRHDYASSESDEAPSQERERRRQERRNQRRAGEPTSYEERYQKYVGKYDGIIEH